MKQDLVVVNINDRGAVERASLPCPDYGRHAFQFREDVIMCRMHWWRGHVHTTRVMYRCTCSALGAEMTSNDERRALGLVEL